MNVPDILKIVATVLASLGAVTGLLIGLLKYLGNIFASQYIEKVKKDFQVEVEKNKTQFALLLSKASKLHDKRFEKIERLYKKIIRLEREMIFMTSRLKIVPLDKEMAAKEEQERIKKAEECFIAFQDYYRENRFFFNEASCALLDKLHKEFFDSFFSYTQGRSFAEEDRRTAYELIVKASKKVDEDIPPVLKQLETELRAIIDVEIK